MTIKDIPKFFEGRKKPGRIIVWKKYNVVLFKVRGSDLEEVKTVFGAVKPEHMRFLYKRMNFWDRFTLKYRNNKRAIRLELR